MARLRVAAQLVAVLSAALIVAGPGPRASAAGEAVVVSVGGGAAPEPATGTSVLQFKVTLSHVASSAVSFTWSTVNESATAPDDFVAVTNAPATIGAGHVSKTLGVTIKSDAADTGAESFTVTLAGITGGEPGTTSIAMAIAPRCTITGSDDQETVTGTGGDDVLCALGGNDIIKPGAGDDWVFGGDGADTVSYSDVAFSVFVDLSIGLASGDDMDRTSSIERIIGSPFGDVLRGDGLNNSIKGGDGDDILFGGDGDDRLEGQGGNDTVDYRGVRGPVTVDLAADSATGAAGTDLVKTIENILSSRAGDVLDGDDGPNTISGGAGDDTINGLAGADTLLGGGGDDVIHGGADADLLLNGQAGSFDVVFGDDGDETGQPRHIYGGGGIHDWCSDGAAVSDGALAGGGCENDVLPA